MTAATNAHTPATAERPKDHVVVLFGATGDLAKRELLPGLFHLAVAGLLPERCRIVGSSRSAHAPTEAAFTQHVRDALDQFATTKPTPETWKSFDAMLSYAPADPDNPAPLVDAVEEAERAFDAPPERLCHLAVPPVAFQGMVEMLGSSGLSQRARVIVEKPFGTDLASARALNDELHKVFDEAHIFRIDHFLGKESVDNILALRFANGIYEPIWNREHVEYVQIDVPETLSIEGRAAFYEGTGAFRDMIVTHLFQVLGFVAMEPPATITAKALREERQKLFDSMEPIDVRHVVRGQYDGYLEEPGVAADSATETFVALRVAIDNWRWSGVPFHLRTGKSLASGRQVVTLGLRRPTLGMFPLDVRSHSSRSNEISIDFADPGAITTHFLTKEPGPRMQLTEAQMVFRYADSFDRSNGLTGYERLILQAMLGDQSLFTSADQVERLWEVSTPLLEHPPAIEPYAKGSWGPASVSRVAAPYHWYLSGRG